MNLDQVKDGVYENVVGIYPQSSDELRVVESSSRFQDVTTGLVLRLRDEARLADCIRDTALTSNLELRNECIRDIAEAFQGLGLDSLHPDHQIAAVREAIKSISAVKFHDRSKLGMPIENTSNFERFVSSIVALATNVE